MNSKAGSNSTPYLSRRAAAALIVGAAAGVGASASSTTRPAPIPPIRSSA
jgi:hypothetical protein